MFDDRAYAGKKLAEHLKTYKNKKNVIVIGLPRGGVVVAHQIAQELGLPLDIIVPRKIGMPGSPEAAIGAITVDGQQVLDHEAIDAMQIEQDYVDREIEKEKKEAARRLKAYRGKKPNLDLKNKIVLLIDDGVATGATMKVSIKAAKVRGVKEIVVAIPVAPQEFIREIEADVDKVICLKTPKDFFAISTHYKRFEQVEDEEVIRLLDS